MKQITKRLAMFLKQNGKIPSEKFTRCTSGDYLWKDKGWMDDHPNNYFVLSNSENPVKIPQYTAFHLSIYCFVKVPIKSVQVCKGL